MSPRPLALVFLVALFACNGDAEKPSEQPPHDGAHTVGKVDVKARFTAATLGDEGCSAVANAPSDAGSCADASSDAGTAACGKCRPTTLQVTFTTSLQPVSVPAYSPLARAHVQSVTLHDLSTGAEVAKLTVLKAQVWDDEASNYRDKEWDGMLILSGETKATYSLSTPALERSIKYRLSIKLSVDYSDGQTLVVESDALTREP